MGLPAEPAASVVQVPLLPTTLHASQGLLQAVSQQTPSTHWLDAHWVGAVHAVPFAAGPASVDPPPSDGIPASVPLPPSDEVPPSWPRQKLLLALHWVTPESPPLGVVPQAPTPTSKTTIAGEAATFRTAAVKGVVLGNSSVSMAFPI